MDLQIALRPLPFCNTDKLSNRLPAMSAAIGVVGQKVNKHSEIATRHADSLSKPGLWPVVVVHRYMQKVCYSHHWMLRIALPAVILDFYVFFLYTACRVSCALVVC